jgi:sugar (pentulose or hexulose) kinase
LYAQNAARLKENTRTVPQVPKAIKPTIAHIVLSPQRINFRATIETSGHDRQWLFRGVVDNVTLAERDDASNLKK